MVLCLISYPAFSQETEDDIARAEPVPGLENVDPDGDSFEIVQRPDEDLLLLEMRLNDLILVDAMPAFLAGSSILLPLRDLTDILEFPIAVETFSGTANGWFLSPNRLFSLNVGRGELILEGQASLFDPRLLEVHEDDIYVDIRLLAQWFPLDLKFDLSNLIVNVASREPLPIEQKIARDDYRQRLLTRRPGDTTNYEKIETPYRLFGIQTADVDTATTFDRDSDGENTIRTEHNVTAISALPTPNCSLAATTARKWTTPAFVLSGLIRMAAHLPTCQASATSMLPRLPLATSIRRNSQ